MPLQQQKFKSDYLITFFQDKTVTSLCSVSDLDCSRLVNEIFNHEQPGGWVDYKYRIKFNPMPQPKENLDFVTILPGKPKGFITLQKSKVKKEEKKSL